MDKEIRTHSIISFKDLKEKKRAFEILFGESPKITLQLNPIHTNQFQYQYEVKKITNNKLFYTDSKGEERCLFAENKIYNQGFIITWWLKEE